MKRRYVAMISAVLCSAMILSACGNSKTESIYTGDKTEVPAWQANLDAISPSAYADVEDWI